MPDRRRMSTPGGPPGGAGESAGPPAAKTRIDPKDFGLAKVIEERGDARMYVARTTVDADMENRPKYVEKDRADVCLPEADKTEITSWVQETRGFTCRKGFKPESPNQDSLTIHVVENKFEIYGVYDGHGPTGHYASEMALTELCQTLLEHPLRTSDPGEALKEVFVNTQKSLSAQKRFDFSSSGTTCTIAYHDLVSDVLTVAYVGDSRCVLGGHNGAKWECHATVDHKPDLPEEKKRIESANPPGRVVFDGYFNHRVFSQKGMYPGLNMSRALGDLVAHAEAGLTAEPEIKVFPLAEMRAKYETLLLIVASDGVWEFIDNEKAVKMVHNELHKGKTCQEAVEVLTKASYDAWMKDSDNEITDDISAIMVQLKLK